jgi:hypothetical protein
MRVRRAGAARDEHRERVALEPRADPERHMLEASLAQQPLQLGVGEAEPMVAKPRLDPLLVVLAQIEQEKPPAGFENARRFGERERRLGRVMQRLREKRDIDAGIRERQVFQLAGLPRDIRHAPPLRERPRPLEHLGRVIDRDDVTRPPCRLER